MHLRMQFMRRSAHTCWFKYLHDIQEGSSTVHIAQFKYMIYSLLQLHYRQTGSNTLHTGHLKYCTHKLVCNIYIRASLCKNIYIHCIHTCRGSQIHYPASHWRPDLLKLYDENRAILITSSKTCTAHVFLTLQIQSHLQ